MSLSTAIVWVLIFLASGTGAWCRFTLDGLISRHWKRSVPVGTLVINVTGAFVLGVLTDLAAHHGETTPLRIILGTGMMGGFTTFSTANVEVVRLMLSGRKAAGLGLNLVMLMLACTAGVLGLFLGGL